jgi:iron complex outermembrane recepter protein
MQLNCIHGFLLFLVTATLHAQQTQETRGFVRDSGSSPLSSVQIIVKKDSITVAKAVSSPDGAFTLPPLNLGQYKLEASLPGFETQRRTLNLNGGNATTLDIELRVAPLATEITVVESGAEIPTASSSATRTATLLIDIPQSVSVIPKELLDQQQVLTAADAVRNTSGVTVANSSGGRMEDLNIRGFTTGAQFKDGFRNDFQSNRAAIEFANIERVEVLKGPSSGLFGRSDPGGVVNYVTKQPIAKHFLQLGLQRGGWHQWRPTLDASGPLNASQSLLYRFNLAYENADSFRDFVSRKRLFFAPALTWQIRPLTSLKFYSEYLGGESVIDRGLIAIGNRPAPLPATRYLGNPNVPYPYKQGKAGLSFEHFFTPNWTFRSSERTSVSYAGYDGWQPTGLLANVAGATLLELREGYSDQNLQSHYWINDLTGRFKTGRIEHTILAGTDLNRESFDSQSFGAARRQRIDIFNPSYVFPSINRQPMTANTRTLNQYAGFYLQDQIKLLPRLKILLGGRYDIAQLANNNFITNLRTNRRATAFVPRTGIVFNPTQSSSLFFNYSRSFLPLNGVTVTGGTFDPERGEVYEGGYKANFLGDRLVATATAFSITRSGITTSDPLNEGFSIQIGQQRNRGVEFDLMARLKPTWTVVATYAHNDPVITRDNLYRPGNFMISAPFQTASLWTNYEVPKGKLRGLSLGAGLFATGKRWGDLENTFIVPGYGRLDASFGYRIFQGEKSHWRIRVNFQNLTDRLYYEGVRGRAGIVPGTPRSAIAGIEYAL